MDGYCILSLFEERMVIMANMANNHSGHKSNRQGAVLMTVLTVACFAAILLTAVITFVKRAHTNAYNNYNSEQAYYIASSALGSIHDYFEEADGKYTKLIDMANANGKTGTDGTITLGDVAMSELVPGGDCTVNVSYMGDNAYIRVSVTGYCNGQCETINAYYTINNNSKPANIDNALYCNGESNFAMSCSSTGSITTGKDFVAQSNNSSATGTIVTGGNFATRTTYHWTNDPNNTANSYIVAKGNFYINNSGCSFLPTLAKNEDNKAQFISIGGAFAPIQSVKIGTDSVKQMDLYCNACYLGGMDSSDPHYLSGDGKNSMSLEMYGNMYCYKDDAYVGKPENGSFIIHNDATGMSLYGNLYVEGIIKLETNHNVNVYGTLYIDPLNTTITTNSGHPITVDAISGNGLNATQVAQWINNGSLRIRKTPGVDGTYVTATDVTTDTEGKYVKQEAINHGTATSRSYKPEVDFDNYKREYENTADFLNNKDTVKALYNSAASKPISDYATSLTDSNLGITFTHVVTDSCYIDTNSFPEPGGHTYYVLVDVDSAGKDVVLRLKPGVQWDGSNGISLENVVFVVKNGKPDSDGKIPASVKSFCYIIAEDSSSTMTVSLSKTIVVDYYTYKNVIKEGKAINLTTYLDDDGNIQNYISANSGYTYNGSDYGVYTPMPTRTYIMANEGDTITMGNQTQNSDEVPLVCEAVVYAPNATIESSGYGSDKWVFLKDVNSTALGMLSDINSDTRLACLGALICETFNGNSNTFGVSFVPPAPGSGVGASSSESTTKVEFSHYESR